MYQIISYPLIIHIGRLMFTLSASIDLSRNSHAHAPPEKIRRPLQVARSPCQVTAIQRPHLSPPALGFRLPPNSIRDCTRTRYAPTIPPSAPRFGLWFP